MKKVRFAETGGEPSCVSCGSLRISDLKTRKRFRCRDCKREFGVLTGTMWAHSKLPFRKLLLLVANFVVPAVGLKAYELAGSVECTETTAFVAVHKIMEAIRASHKSMKLSGVCQADTMFLGKYVRPLNDRTNKRYPHRSPNTIILGAVVERDGRAVTKVVLNEKDMVEFVRETAAYADEIHTDEASHWTRLGETPIVKTVNHAVEFSSYRFKDDNGTWRFNPDGACTNAVENFFSIVRRAERLHTHIARPYLHLYAAEIAWRYNCRRMSNADKYEALLKLCLNSEVSRSFKGYWQNRRNHHGDTNGFGPYRRPQRKASRDRTTACRVHAENEGA